MINKDEQIIFFKEYLKKAEGKVVSLWHSNGKFNIWSEVQPRRVVSFTVDFKEDDLNKALEILDKAISVAIEEEREDE